MTRITHINGFEIDKYNQYNLKEGARTSTCPECSEHRKKKTEKCAMVDWDRGILTCQHCSAVLQLHTFKRKESIVNKVYTRPTKEPKTKLPKKVIDWWGERGINEDTLKFFKIGYGQEWMQKWGKEVGTIQFPSYLQGELVNIKYRDGSKNKSFKLFKDAEKILYNIDSIFNSPVAVIVEGEPDAMAVHQSGIKTVVSVPNGATLGHNNLDYIDNYYESHLEDKEKVILAVDKDAAGEALRAEFIRRLGAEKCYLVDFDDCKDANEYMLKHGEEALKELLENAEQVPLENVETVKDHMEALKDLVRNGFSKGFIVGLDNFDEIFSTYTKQFITVTGIPSSGKSDFVDQMCVGYNENYGWKVAYASPENHPLELHTHKLTRKIWGGLPSKEDIDTEKWDETMSYVDDNFFFINMEKYDLRSVLKKGAELVKRKGIKVLVIDPFNKVRLKGKDVSGDVNQYTMEYLNEIDDFCKKHDVLTFIVAHPNKMYPDRSGGSNKMPIPSMYDIKGGGEWYDASYHGLVVHRDYENDTTIVKVNKVKFQNLGTNGAECYFKWDKMSGRYLPEIPIPDNDVPVDPDF